MEEELEILEDVPVGLKRSRDSALDIAADNDDNDNKKYRSFVADVADSPEKSPFLERANVEGKPSPTAENDSCHMNNLMHLNFLIKQQKLLSEEIERIKVQVQRSSERKSNDFRDDTAHAYDRGYLSRHSSEPEAQSLGPRKQKVADRGQNRSQSIDSGKKGGGIVHGGDADDDQLSLCTPVNPVQVYQRGFEEEVRTNESGENMLQEYMPYNKSHLAESLQAMDRRIGSNRSSGKSSSGHLPCVDYCREGKHSQMHRQERHRMGSRNRSYQDVCQGSDFRYSHSTEFTHDCPVPNSRYPSHFAPQAHPTQGMAPAPQMQQTIPGSYNPYVGIQNSNSQRAMPNMFGPRVPVLQDSYQMHRMQDPYMPMQMGHHVHQPQYPVRMPLQGPGAMNRPVNKFTPSQCDVGAQPVHVKRTTSPTYTARGNATFLHRSTDVDRIVTCPQPDVKETKTEQPPDATENARGESHEKRTDEPLLTDIPDINLSPEDFDAIFAEFNADDLPQ